MVKGLWNLIKPQDGKVICGQFMSLLDLGKKHFEETKKDLVLLTDYSIISWFYISGYMGLNWKVNGDYQLLRKAFKEFFTLMKENHITFVFFFKVLSKDKPGFEQQKRKALLETTIKMMKTIDDSSEKQDIIPMPSYAITELGYFVKEENYPYFNISDKAVMYSYGRKNCDGAFLNDTDALAHNLSLFFVDSLKIENKNVQCINFTPEAVANYLKFPIKFFPLFASLVGNDFTLGIEELEKYRSSFKKAEETRSSVLTCIAESLAKYSVDESIESIIEKLTFKPATKKALLAGCSFYSVDITPESDKDSCIKQMNDASVPFNIPDIIFNSFYNLRNLYSVSLNNYYILPVYREYFGKDFLGDPGMVLIGNTEPVNTITIPLRKKLYSMLNYQKREEDLKPIIEEGPLGEKYDKREALYELCSDRVKKAFTGKTKSRVELFFAALGCENLNLELIETPVMMLLYSALGYILHYQDSIMFEWEFDALISSVNDTINPSELPAPEKVTARGLYVYSVFSAIIQIAVQIGAILHVFPNDEIPAPDQLFNASSFHYRYNAAHDQLKCAVLSKELKELKEKLKTGDKPIWLDKKERSPPYTIYVRSLDIRQTEDEFRALFEPFEPKNINFDPKKMTRQENEINEEEVKEEAKEEAKEEDKEEAKEEPKEEPKEQELKEEEYKTECTYAFIEFNDLNSFRSAMSLNGHLFGRFKIEIFAVQKDGYSKKEVKDREGFEVVQSKRSKETKKRNQTTSDGKPRPKPKKVSEESVFKAHQRAHQKEIESIRRSKKISIQNAFAALEDEDE